MRLLREIIVITGLFIVFSAVFPVPEALAQYPCIGSCKRQECSYYAGWSDAPGVCTGTDSCCFPPPTNTPGPATVTPIPTACPGPPNGMCNVGVPDHSRTEGEFCYQTTQCVVGQADCYSSTCQGLQSRICDPGDCGTCYCTDSYSECVECCDWRACIPL